MAEAIVTAGTEPAPVLDKYGRPCPIAAALRRFNECGFAAIDDTRGLETYRLVHQIARGLDDIINRLETMGAALEMLPELMGPDSDNDHARAAVEMAVPYRIDIANRTFELCGQVMAAIERGGLLPVTPQQGGAHG